MTAKRARVVTAKHSKNACRTCRTRRVKCDEARPTCLRCISAGRKCDGYSTPSPRHDSSNVVQRKLLPAIQPQPSLSITVRYAQATGPTTDVERNAFTFFLQETAPPLELILGPLQFIRRALQTSNELPAVFNAITAVGCMAFARAQIHIADCTLTQLKTDMREEVPLYQYCKATSSLQKYIDSAVVEKADVEPVLICSLLFVLFEVFRGEIDLALSHLRYGRRALQQILDSGISERSSVTSAAMDELVKTFDMLGKESLASSLPPNSQQLAVQCISVTKSDLCQRSFESLQHAKQTLENLTVRTCSWREELLYLANSKIESMALEDSFSIAARFCIAQCLSRSIILSPDFSRRKDDLIAKYEKWSRMLATTQVPDAADTHGLHMLMQLQHFYSYFLLRTARDTTELELDHMSGEFRRTLDLAERYLNAQSGSNFGPAASPGSYERLMSFSLEAGPLPVLFLICLKCRDQYLRQRALRLLQHANRREGLQYSGELSVYADCIVRFEEERARHLLAKEGKYPDIPLDWWFERILEAARYPSLVIQGIGYHEIRVIGCRYLSERCREIELIELRGSGIPPLTLEEMRRVTIAIPDSISTVAAK